jgi:hypothetical protein
MVLIDLPIKRYPKADRAMVAKRAPLYILLVTWLFVGSFCGVVVQMLPSFGRTACSYIYQEVIQAGPYEAAGEVNDRLGIDRNRFRSPDRK